MFYVQTRYTHGCVVISTTTASGYILECHPLEKAKICSWFKGKERGDEQLESDSEIIEIEVWG